MKTNFYAAFVALFLSALCKAQSPSDAIRFAFTNYGGTARYQAIGGAMGSLGGEFSASLVNPAGIGLYRTREWVVSPGWFFGHQKNNYRGESNKVEQDGNFHLGASGVLISDNRNAYNNHSTFAYSFGLSQTANFRNNLSYRAPNNISSQSEVFLEDLSNYGANGGFSNIPQYMNDVRTGYGYLRLGGTLAYNTGLVDSLIDRTQTPNQFNWLSKMKDTVNQQNNLIQRGGIYDLFGAIGGSIGQKWYFGASLNISILNYSRERIFSESDATANLRAGVREYSFTDYSRTTGLGASGKLGAIYKPKEFLRFGLAIHTPTYYSLTDTYNNAIAVTAKDGSIQRASSNDYNNGNSEEEDYNFRTPWRFILSGSYVFREIKDVTKQKGFITADIEYVPYGWMRYTPRDPADADMAAYLNSRNSIIRSLYKGNFNFRIGGELKFKIIMLRAGYGFYGNPYRASELRTNLHRLSGGIGYRNRGFFTDLTYVHNFLTTADVPYRIEANTPFAGVRGSMGNVILTFGVKF